MGSTVRSVDVRLNAMVAGYIRDVNRAGDATEKAFDKVHTSTSRARESIVETDQAMGKLNATTQVTSPSQKRLATDVDRVSVAAVRGSASIDKYSGRIRILGELLATIGPGLLPIGAGGVAALAGLAGLFGGATVGALGLFVAVQGVGDALTAVEKARLDPTVANLQAAEEAMSNIAPEAREFVARFQELRPVLKAIRDAGAEGLFPGLTDSLDSLERLAPTLEKLVATSGRAGGSAIARGADSLTTERWMPFFEFLTDEIPDAIDDASRLVGSLAHAGTELWMAFDPTNDNFIDWLVDVADGFDRWSSSASGREDVQDFLEYVEKTGPKVGDFIVGAADALTQMAQAAAPLSGPVLEGLTAISKAVAAIADSDLGTPIITGVAALTLYSRGLQAAVALQTKLSGGTASQRLNSQGVFGFTKSGIQGTRTGIRQLGADVKTMGATWATVGRGMERQNTSMNAALTRTKKTLGTFGKSAAIMGGLALATTGVADGMGVTNTASLALMGTMVGPLGAALGATAGLILDMKSGTDAARDSIESMQDAIDSMDMSAMQSQLDGFLEQNSKYLDGDWTFGDTLSAGFKDLLSLGGFSNEISSVSDKLLPALERGAQMQRDYNDALRDGGRAAFEAEHGINALISAMERQQSQARTALDNQYAWGQSVRDIRALLADGSRGFNEFTEAGQNNFAAISGAAEALNSMVEAGELSNQEYVKLRGEFIQFTTALGAGKNEAAGFANELLDFPDYLAPQIAVQFDKQELLEAKAAFDSLPRDVRTEIKALGIPQTDAAIEGLVRKYKLTEKERRALVTLKDQASPTIQNVLGLLRQVRSKSITVKTTFETFYAPPTGKKQPKAPLGPLNMPGSADGGFVPKTGLPYADRHAYLLADGEGVTTNRNGETDRFRDVVSGINAGLSRAQVKGMLANGGFAGGNIVTRSSSLVTSGDREANAVAGGLRGLTRELRAAEKAVASERKQRESLISTRGELRSGVREGLGKDIWRPGTNDWTSGGPKADIDANIAEIRMFDNLTGRLKKNGAKNGFLDAILSEGDLATAQAYAGLSKKELTDIQRSFNLQQRELTRVSNSAGDAAYGAAIKESVREERRAVAELKQIKAAVNRGTHTNSKEQRENRRTSRKGASVAGRARSMSRLDL